MRKIFNVGDKVKFSNGTFTVTIDVTDVSRGKIKAGKSVETIDCPKYGPRKVNCWNVRFMKKIGNYQFSEGHVNGKHPAAYKMVA